MSKDHLEKIESSAIASMDDGKNAILILADKVRLLEKENAELREFKDSAMPVLENLLFWDTVPDQWKEVISELVKGGSDDE